MSNLVKLIAILVFITFVAFINIYAPTNVKATLNKNGYSNIITKRSFLDFHFDFCGNDAIRINFTATKNGINRKGYVCAYSIFSDGIYDDLEK
jgi:hypothetical protein